MTTSAHLAALSPETFTQLGVLLTPLVSFACTWFVKRFLPRLPSYAYPIAAALFGAGATLLADLSGLVASSPWLGLLLGLAATGLHQIYAQLSANVTTSDESAL
jgi:hypothetical protein